MEPILKTPETISPGDPFPRQSELDELASLAIPVTSLRPSAEEASMSHGRAPVTEPLKTADTAPPHLNAQQPLELKDCLIRAIPSNPATWSGVGQVFMTYATSPYTSLGYLLFGALSALNEYRIVATKTEPSRSTTPRQSSRAAEFLSKLQERSWGVWASVSALAGPGALSFCVMLNEMASGLEGLLFKRTEGVGVQLALFLYVAGDAAAFFLLNREYFSSRENPQAIENILNHTWRKIPESLQKVCANPFFWFCFADLTFYYHPFVESVSFVINSLNATLAGLGTAAMAAAIGVSVAPLLKNTERLNLFLGEKAANRFAPIITKLLDRAKVSTASYLQGAAAIFFGAALYVGGETSYGIAALLFAAVNWTFARRLDREQREGLH